MKINKFFMGFAAMAALSLAACSNDEPANGGDTPNVPSFTEDQAFIAVKISEQTQGGRSRAKGDINQEGEGENQGNWFEDGYTLGESKVKSCDFYFYDEAGKFVLTSNTLFAAGDQDMPNVEIKGQGVVVLDQVKQKGYPKYMVTILNKPAGFTAPLTLEEMNTKLVEMPNVTTTDGAVKDGEYFTMTTTSWANQTSRLDKITRIPYYFVTELTTNDFFTTPEKAKEAENAVKVFVERLAAKTAVKVGMTPVENLENTFKIEISVAGAGNSVDGEGDYVAEYPLYVKLSGWGLNATPKDSYYMKNIDESWTQEYLGFFWNSSDYNRSYWGKSYTYNKGQQADYNYFSYASLDNKFWEADELDKQHAAYTAENTHGKLYLNDPTKYNRFTSILLQAEVYDPNDGQGKDFVMYNGLLFKGDRFVEYAVSRVAPNLWVKNEEGNGYKQVSAGFALNNDGAGNSVYVKFAPEAGVTYYASTDQKDEEDNPVYNILTDFTEINEDLATVTGEGFQGGKMYYNIPIRHLREIKKGADGVLERTFAKGNLEEGDYGVVRNHYYFTTITSIAKLGTGVWNPEEVIIPNNPPQDEEYYVGAEISILSWRIVDNNVEL